MAELSITLNEKDTKLISEQVTRSVEELLTRVPARWYGSVDLPVNRLEYNKFEEILTALNTNPGSLSVDDIFFAIEMTGRYAQWSDTPLTQHLNIEHGEDTVGIGVSATMHTALIERLLKHLKEIDQTKRTENHENEATNSVPTRT